MSLSKRKEAPLDPFKRALTLATRSIAADGTVEVIFSNEPPGLYGKTARLPEPSRVPTRNEIAVIRGHADAAALAVACHDPGLHAKLAPPGGEARAVFEAIEQARVEAIGAQRMEGVSANLTARLEQRYERSRINESTDRSEAPLPEALALLVRERLTGLAPPSKARAIANLWRPVDRGPRARGARSHARHDLRPGCLRPPRPRPTCRLEPCRSARPDWRGRPGGEGGRAGAFRGGGRDRRRRADASSAEFASDAEADQDFTDRRDPRRARGRRGRSVSTASRTCPTR